MEPSDDRATRRASSRAAVVVAVLTVVLVGALVVAVVTLSPRIRGGSDLSLPTGRATTALPTGSDIDGRSAFSDELRSAASPPGLARLPRMSTAPTPGQVVYALTGDGVVAGVSYATTGLGKFGVLDGRLPWSLAVDVQSVPELSTIVIDGTVTCTIRRDDRVLAEATSSSGELTCRASEG